MILKAHSKGLYSSWYYYAPDRVLFDCGEGVSLHLKSGIFAIEKVFLSHGHMDHLFGLPMLLNLRQSTKGANEKPLEIYYPSGEKYIEIMRETLDRMLGQMIEYPLTWHSLQAGDRVELRGGRVLEAGSAEHSSAENPLCFTILESRKRLKTGLRDLAPEALRSMSPEEKLERHEVKLMLYSGDTAPMSPEVYEGVELLIHDCTFLDAADRNRPIHSTLQETFDLASEAGVKRLVLTHISPRYDSQQAIEALIGEAESHGLTYYWVPHDRVFEL